MTKRIITLLTLLSLVICLSSCGNNKNIANDDPKETTEATEAVETNEANEETEQTTPVRGGVLNLCIYEADSLNPLTTQNENNLDILRLVFDGLFSVKNDYSVENSLCESYEISEDGLSYSFHIKNGISFHDGTKLKASDVDASFKLITEANSPYLSRFASVESTSFAGMTWQVVLKEPVINFTALLDFPILPEKDANLENNITNISYTPNGTGIYKVSDYKETKELYLSINENHFSGRLPHIPEIKINIVKDKQTAVSMFENLYIDVLPDSVVNLSEYTPKRNSTKSISYPKNNFTFLGLNNQKPILLSQKVRQAIAHCIDKNTMTNDSKTHISVSSDIPVNKNSVYYNKNIGQIIFDTNKAVALLQEDGFVAPEGSNILEKDIYGETHQTAVDILVNSENPSRLKIAESIKTQLEKVGFFVTISSVDFDTYTERIYSKNYDMFIGSMNISQNHDLSFMLQTDKNIFGISNERIDLCLNQLKLLSNPTAITGAFNDLCSYLYEDMPIIGLYFDNGLLLCSKNVKGNITPAESNLFVNIYDWFIS